MTPGWDGAMDAVWAGMKTALISYISARVRGCLGTSTMSSDTLQGSALNSGHKMSVNHVVNRCAVYPHYVPFAEHRQRRFRVIQMVNEHFVAVQSPSRILLYRNPMDCSPPGSWDSPGKNTGFLGFWIHGILQARILKWAVIHSPGDLSDPQIEPGSPALQADSSPFEYLC